MCSLTMSSYCAAFKRLASVAGRPLIAHSATRTPGRADSFSLHAHNTSVNSALHRPPLFSSSRAAGTSSRPRGELPMQHVTLRMLLDDRRPYVASSAAAVAAGLAGSGPAADHLDLGVEKLIEAMTHARSGMTPRGSSALSTVDSALITLLGLRRVIFLAQTVEDQLDLSEADLLTPAITGACLKQAAEDLGCTHLHPPQGPQPERGLVVSTKQHVVVVRTVRVRSVALSVAFLLDTSAPASFVCAETLHAFGVNADTRPGGFVRGEMEGGMVLDLHCLDPRGGRHDLNILGMDYLQRSSATLKFLRRSRSVLLTTK